MVYCQDCGATNKPADPTCRICPHPLDRDRSLTPCTTCGECLGKAALFCSHCGSPVPLLAESLMGTPGPRVVDSADDESHPGPTRPSLSTVRSSPAREVREPLAPGSTRDGSSRGATRDTTSFISEDDLPPWLRHVIAMETAQSEAEATRVVQAEADAGRHVRAAVTADAARQDQEMATVQEGTAAQPAPSRKIVSVNKATRDDLTVLPSATADLTPLELAPPVEDLETVTPAPRVKKPRRERRIKPAAAPEANTARRTPKIRRSDPRLVSTSNYRGKLLLAGSVVLICIALVMLLAPDVFG